MYYNCRPLKYVTYGKVTPPPIEEVGFEYAYNWLGHYCGGYCPQIWLSRSTSHITGYKTITTLKRSKYDRTKRSKLKEIKDSVLFGFEDVQGFPVDYEIWCFIMGAIESGYVNEMKKLKNNINLCNKKIIQSFIDFIRYEDEWEEECKRENTMDQFEKDPILIKWKNSKDLDDFLKRYLFVKNDQVVVPSLNLKSAKKIICFNEKQKKKLRHMGFIEDRIRIKK